MSGAAAIFGFADAAGPLAGVAWSLAGATGALVAHDGESWSEGAEVRDGEEPGFAVSLGSDRCEVALAAGGSLAPLLDAAGEALPGEPAAGAPRAAVRISGAGGERELSCDAHLTRWGSDPTAVSGVVRHLACPSAGGGLLVLLAGGPAGAAGHGEERTSAWRLDAGGCERFSESLLSTQYDEQGRISRAGIELWPAGGDAPPLRAAGARPLAAIERSAAGLTAALLHTSAGGHSGIGSYLLWRA